MRHPATGLPGAILLFASLLASGAAAAQTPTPPDSARAQTYTYTEKMPVFPVLAPADSALSSVQRFSRFINADVHYPPRALRDGIAGKVYFTFTVNAEGRTQDIRIAKGLRDDVDAEALRNARRLEAIRWEPGTQNGRAVTVTFTAPMSFRINPTPGQPGSPDSLLAPGFNKVLVPALNSWDPSRRILPTDKGLVYGSCVQRLGFSSGGLAQYVRLANLSTGKSVRIEVKPAMRSRKESAFCYALPPGRYALYRYEFSLSKWYGPEMHQEDIAKPAPTARLSTADTRYVFTVAAGQVACVGTWDFTQENAPAFVADKARLDAELQPIFKNLALQNAALAVPR